MSDCDICLQLGCDILKFIHNVLKCEMFHFFQHKFLLAYLLQLICSL